MFNRQARIIMEQIEEWATKDIPQETWKEWVIELLEESLTAATERAKEALRFKVNYDNQVCNICGQTERLMNWSPEYEIWYCDDPKACIATYQAKNEVHS